MYRGDGTGGFLGMRVIGAGWARYDGLMLTGDFDGDSAPDFLARNPAKSELRLYRSNGTGGFATTRIVGTGWNIFTRPARRRRLVRRRPQRRPGPPDRRHACGCTAATAPAAGSPPYPTIGSGWNTIRLPGEGATASVGSVCTNPYFTTSNSQRRDHRPAATTCTTTCGTPAKYHGTKGTTQVCSYRSWNHIGTASNTSGNGEVKTYPNVHKDYSRPHDLQLLAAHLDVCRDVARSRHLQRRLRPVAQRCANDEVMIWTDNHKQYPAGSPVRLRRSLSGRTWDVYATSGNGYIAFVPSNGARYTSGTLDIKAMLNYLVSKGRVSSSATVDQICYGVEIVDTGGSPATWRFTDFSITDS